MTGFVPFLRFWVLAGAMALLSGCASTYLLDNHADAYFVTDHYRGYPAVLARLAVVDRQHLATMLEEAWRQVAPKRLLREHDARTAADPS